MIRVPNQRTSLLRTLDAIDSERLGDMAAAEIELALGGLLDADDLEKVRSIMAKYNSGSGTTQTGLTTPTGDALARRLAEVEHNGTVADGYRKFWDEKNAEFDAAITR
jgi:hypothetical protein